SRQDRSGDFSPLPAVLAGPERGGLKSALLNSMAVGSGRGDFKRARQFDGTSPSPQPSPCSCLAGRGATSAMVAVSRCVRAATRCHFGLDFWRNTMHQSILSAGLIEFQKA